MIKENHNYSDAELTERVLGLARHDCCNLSVVESNNPRCLQFKITYAHEDFFADFVEVYRDQQVGWFIVDGSLYVYKAQQRVNR